MLGVVNYSQRVWNCIEFNAGKFSREVLTLQCYGAPSVKYYFGIILVYFKVMDKTLTPSRWTTLMNYSNGLRLPLRILLEMSGMLRSCDYILTLY